jgi:uncharacterized protein (TIGR02246 family)
MTTTTTGGLSIADRLEIQDLYGRYAITIDSGDAAGWAACFTEDGRMTVGDLLDLNGRGPLAEFATGHHASPHGAARHHFTTITVTGMDAGAAGRAYALMSLGGEVTAAMSYVDELLRENGAWRFASRTVTPEAAPAE